MDWRTGLDVLLAILAAYLGIKNYQLSQHREQMSQRREDRQESQDFVEIKVQYNQVMDTLRDLQKDMKSVSILNERVIKIETNINEIYRRVERLEEKYGN